MTGRHVPTVAQPTLTLAIALLVAGCGDDEPAADDAGSSGTDSGSTTGTTESDAGSQTAGDSSGSNSPDPTTSAATGSSSTDAGDTSGTESPHSTSSTDDGTTGESTTGESTTGESTTGESTTDDDGSSSGGSTICNGMPPEITAVGSDTLLLLGGLVLAPGGPFEGHVLVDGDTITCVAEDCSALAVGATIVDTHAILSPGLLDSHNHPAYGVFDDSDWVPAVAFQNHLQVGADPGFGAVVDAQQYLRNDLDLECELVKYGEMKGLVAATTSIVGSGSDPCFASVARSLESGFNDLPDDTMQTSVTLPLANSADTLCADFLDGSLTSWVVHAGEGVDATALAEFGTLAGLGGGCLLAPQTTIVHSTAFGAAELSTMGAAGMNLTWSPRSNVRLFGFGDLSQTADIPTALAEGVRVSIAPDYSITGSANILDEMRFADDVDDAVFGDLLSAQDIWEAVTIAPAQALHVDALLGSLEVGKRADLAVFSCTDPDPYESILASTPEDVQLVILDGRALYGNADLVDLGPANAICETLDVCDVQKFACIGESDGDPNDRLAQTFEEIRSALEGGMTEFDAVDAGVDFAPIAALTLCR